ncbi:sodium/calcium exchanger 1 isoform X1 [Lepisosteus oculatus]|uniref:Solute carrier family 8 member 1b n=1 Tax=Lepisosteus oculatus TaxID=7918 RepID=W5NFH2_LEPOC|nr:PREDICTED: sodium/calcium exchanger 1 isoform X1 [Lepisosteus oculatus]XP_015218092.1 PREDICTED: sodium/calcium exchanger 1 isoform X1 [Lepisosteus oculatus]XP_015218093.1 PREDICTED: sodium/calcium exchanger 1 isoform X1 [Lepisosteus oculatus]
MQRSGLSSFFSLSLQLGILVAVLVLKIQLVGAESLDDEDKPPNATARSCTGTYECKEGVILPVWEPQNPSFGDKVARATVYFVAMVYMFLGVSIIADRFMASIEVITSQEKEITIKKPNGETTTTTVRIWNETVSNLTLMALGSSAPEILLSVIEVCGHGFEAGDLGPSTIVGSAAFNMFVIIGICVYVVPDGENRKVKHLRVFFVTAAWSIFAYTWLYLILAVISPGVVQVWEGLLTLFFFPICVLFAWVADRRLLFYKYVYKRYRTGKQRGMIIETEGDRPLPSKADIEMDGKMLNSHAVEFLDGTLALDVDDKDLDEEETRRDMAKILKELKQKHPDKEVEQLIELANYQVLSQQQKSRAFYRIQATRLMTGAGNILKKHAADQARKAVSMHEVRTEVAENDPVTKIFFEPGSYQCLENCGTVTVNVIRRGGDLTNTVSVEFRTEDGTANAGSDYEFTEGTLVFKPGETQKEIKVGIIDDDIFEEDENFLIHLSNVKVYSENAEDNPEANHVETLACLGIPSTATVTIFDDDHAGIFTFEEPVTHVSESIGTMEVKVLRTSGARGMVVVPYRTVEGTAKGGGEDFEDTHGVLEFRNDETFKTIKVKVIDDEEYEKNKNFFVEIGEPRLVEMSEKKALLLHEYGGFVKTGSVLYGQNVYRKVQSRDNPVPSSVICFAEEGDETEPLTGKDEEERRIAEMGRPMLGEHMKLEVTIEESYEFKSTVDKLIKKTNLALLVGTNSWRDQFIEAITVSAGEDDDDDECGEEKLPSCFDYVMHFLTVFWKVLFAFVPPTEYWNGWACFIVSICMIGLLTAFIGDLASHFGCTIGLKDSVTAVVFVALGTSVPDTFASKVAAIQDQYADASIGNVTGSNAVNVFLGIGVAWSIAAVYHQAQGRAFRVDPGTLAFSVTLFTIFAFICVGVLLYRRRPEIGGELGGPRTPKILTTMLFVSLWLLYILFSSLEAYCHVKGF